MRAQLAIAAILLAGPALAGPLRLPSVPRDSLMPRWDVARYTPESERDGLPGYARFGRRDGGEAQGSGLSFGPIHAESETINGHRRVHYRVDGLTLFGGDIGGSVSRRGAMLTLHWASPAD